MDATGSAWVWAAGLGGAGGAVSAWLGRLRSSQPAFASLGPGVRRGGKASPLSYIAGAAAIAAGTAAATAWMMASAATVTALAFFWIGFVTAGWMAAERDKQLLHRAVCRAATAPAAHPDTVQELEHASADAVYEAVQALVPRPVVR